MEVFEGDERGEASLVRAAAEGDAAAFEGLFHRYYDMIHAYAYHMAGNAAEAADLAQETWIRVARGLAGYQGRASFKNWVYAIAHHVILDAGRRKARMQRLHEQFIHQGEEATAPEALPTPDAAEDLRNALLSLPANLRAAITLVYLEEMNHAEAAKILRCAEATISWRLFQARRKLKKLLSREARP